MPSCGGCREGNSSLPRLQGCGSEPRAVRIGGHGRRSVRGHAFHAMVLHQDLEQFLDVAFAGGHVRDRLEPEAAVCRQQASAFQRPGDYVQPRRLCLLRAGQGNDLAVRQRYRHPGWRAMYFSPDTASSCMEDLKVSGFIGSISPSSSSKASGRSSRSTACAPNAGFALIQ
jgi:hypothetical protein